MSGLELLICGLAAWRLARLLALDDGPFEIFARLRGAVYGSGGVIEKLLACPYWCLTVWTGAFVGVTWAWLSAARVVWTWLAIAQVAALAGLASEHLAGDE